MSRVGVDVGGTFTDVAYLEPGGAVRVAKVLTRVSRPWASVAEGVKRVVDPASLDLIIHATTLGTNMLLGQVGLEKPHVYLLVSRGFRDVIEIGRQARPEPYNAFFTRPEPLVPRDARLEIDARIYRDGSIREPDCDEVSRMVRGRCHAGTVFVIGVINCFADGGRLEARIAECVRRACPEAIVEWSCRVDPRPGEYERFSTAIVNAILRPLFAEYMLRLRESLASVGFQGRVLVMQSSGETSIPDVASENPVYFIESGPAAGVVAAAYFARLHGEEQIVAFDMGGTTAKASLIVEGQPILVDYFEVGGKFHAGRLVRGSGYPIRVPHIDLVEVSAGGGTIVWVDKGGGLRVGPLSAGSEPGPACYRRGGTKPTITDAHLLLGRLPSSLAGGLLQLDKIAALRAYERVARDAGLEPLEAAAEALRLANVEMARALRLVTIERGVDPSRVTIYAFGGSGPLHAAELAEELGIPRVYIPPHPGVFTALGLILAPLGASRLLPLRGVLSDRILAEARRLASEEAPRLATRLGCPEYYTIAAYLLARYEGQGESIRIPLMPSDAHNHIEEFERTYLRHYGLLPPAPRPHIVVDALLLRVQCPSPRLQIRASPESLYCCERRVYMLNAGWVTARVYHGVPPEVKGPAVIELETSTIIVPPGWSGRRDSQGGLLLEAL